MKINPEQKYYCLNYMKKRKIYWFVSYVIQHVIIFHFNSISFLSAMEPTALSEDPEFTDIIENITVPAGRNVKLACSVKNLGTYKVI